MYDPQNGEKPIDTLPEYGGAGGSQQAMEYYAGQKFKELFDRNPTPSELTMLASAYQGDPNIANISTGNATVAQYFNSISNSPDNLQKQRNDKLSADAPKYYDQINQMFQATLNRPATDAEKQHFGSFMASGQVDAYSIGEFLKALPENVKRQDAAFREGLNKTLQGQDAQYYNEQILPSLQANATRQGRSLDSSGVSNSLALAAQQQNRGREGFLSGLSAQQYGGSQDLAQRDYMNTYGNYQNFQNYSMNRSAQLSDAYTGRINELGNYSMQKRAYDDYLRRYGKSNNPISGILGGATAGGMAGGSTGNPYAAGGGAIAGGLLGYFGSKG